MQLLYGLFRYTPGIKKPRNSVGATNRKSCVRKEYYGLILRDQDHHTLQIFTRIHITHMHSHHIYSHATKQTLKQTYERTYKQTYKHTQRSA